MDSSDITPEQAKRIHEVAHRMLGYLHRLEKRLTELSFDPRDPFYALVVEAHNSIHKLSVESHYMSCKGGVSRPERK